MNRSSSLLKLANDLDKKGEIKLADKLERLATIQPNQGYRFLGQDVNTGGNWWSDGQQNYYDDPTTGQTQTVPLYAPEIQNRLMNPALPAQPKKSPLEKGVVASIPLGIGAAGVGAWSVRSAIHANKIEAAMKVVHQALGDVSRAREAITSSQGTPQSHAALEQAKGVAQKALQNYNKIKYPTNKAIQLVKNVGGKAGRAVGQAGRAVGQTVGQAVASSYGGLSAGSGTMTGVGGLGAGLAGGAILAAPIVAGGAAAYWAGQELNKAYQQNINSSEDASQAGANYLTMLRQKEQQTSDPAQKQYYRQLYQKYLGAQASEYGVDWKGQKLNNSIQQQPQAAQPQAPFQQAAQTLQYKQQIQQRIQRKQQEIAQLNQNPQLANQFIPAKARTKMQQTQAELQYLQQMA